METRRYGESDFEFRREFSIRLKQLRIDNDMTLLKIVNGMIDRYDIHMTFAALSNYERNLRMPDSFLLSKFADFFDVTADYLLGRTDTKNAIVIESSFVDNNNISHTVNLGVTKNSDLIKMSPAQIKEFIVSLKDSDIPFDI